MGEFSKEHKKVLNKPKGKKVKMNNNSGPKNIIKKFLIIMGSASHKDSVNEIEYFLWKILPPHERTPDSHP